jgi:hypothetical protein
MLMRAMFEMENGRTDDDRSSLRHLAHILIFLHYPLDSGLRATVMSGGI